MPIKSGIFFLLLFLAPFKSTPAQSASKNAEDCNYAKKLLEYAAKDSVEPITNPVVLYEMATTASAARSKEQAKSYYQRILAQKKIKQELIYYQAMLDQYLRYDIAFDPDTLRRAIQQSLGAEHELFAVLDLTTADHQYRTRQKVNLDSIVPASISKIKSKTIYKNFITISLQDLSRDYSDKGQLEKGMEAARELSDFVTAYYPDCAYEIGGTFITLGRRHLDLGSLDSAAYYFEQSLDFHKQHQPDDFQAISMATFNLADVFKNQGYHLNALNILRDLESYVLRDTVLSKNLLPNIYNAMGVNYREMNNKYKAITFFRKSILFSEQATPGPSSKKLAAYANISSEFMAMDKLDIAEEYAKKALDMSLRIFGAEHRFTAILLMKMGSINYENGNYELCKSYFDQSLVLRKKIYGESHPSLSNIYLNYSIMHRDLKDYDLALFHINKAIEIYEAHYGENHPLLARAYLNKASVEFLKGDIKKVDTAIEAGKKALNYQGSFKTVSDPILYLDLVDNEVLFKFADYKENGNGNIDEIVESFAQVMTIFDYHLELTEEISDMSEFSSDYSGLFDSYTEALVLQGRKNNSGACFEQAFAINNKGKTLGLFKSLKQQNLLLYAKIPPELRKDLSDLKRKIKATDQELAALGMDRTKERTVLLDSLNQLRKKLVVNKLAVNKILPTFDQFKNAKPDLKLPSIIPAEGSQIAILDYRVLDSALITFVLFGGEIRADYIPLDAGFSKAVNALQASVIERDPNYRFESNAVDALLQSIATLPAEITQLVIIPDKNLSAFPFEILTINEEPLLSKYAISYANSASIRELQQGMKKGKRDVVFSGFAPEYAVQVDTFNSKVIADLVRSGNWQLPFAKEEISFIGDLLNGQIFCGKDATKDNLFEALKNSQIVHLSMHAQADNASPMNSSFIFNSDTLKTAQNLFLYELYDLNAQSDLLVLSACETGVGNFHQGDGVRSLGNGFLYAGVPSVVMSLWKVPDESTSIIMKNFYTFLEKGDSKARALQKAKQEYLANTVSVEQKHPYYWAGFILSGNEAPMDLKTRLGFKKVAMLTLGALLFMAILMFFNIPRKS